MWRKHRKTNDGGCSAPVTALKGDPRYSKVSQLYNIPLIPNICTFYWRENTTILIDLRGSQRLEFITGNKIPSSSSVPFGLRCTPFFSSKLAFLVDLETKGANCILWSNLHNFMTVHIYIYTLCMFLYSLMLDIREGNPKKTLAFVVLDAPAWRLASSIAPDGSMRWSMPQSKALTFLLKLQQWQQRL